MLHRQRINVPFEFAVAFTRGLFELGNETITEALPRDPDVDGAPRAMVFIEKSVVRHWADLPDKIEAWMDAHPQTLKLVASPMIIEGGESCKNDLLFVQRMTHQFQRENLDRHSYVIVIGGGAALDAVGLSAAVFHRGLRLIRVPTTVLAQADSAVGVKNAINMDGVKNLIGTFAPPAAVLNDLEFLRSLEQRDWLNGLSEAFKVACIKDVSFLNELELLAAKLVARDLDAMQRVVERCAVLHMDHIRTGGDPFEFGSARPLDFGHWSAHKLESMTQHEVRHGEAVAIGLALDLYCASQMGYITDAERDRVCTAMEACGLRLYHPTLSKASGPSGTLQIVAGLEEFRQHLGGRLTLTMPDGLGKKKDIHDLPNALVEAAVKWLQQRDQKAAQVTE